MKNRDLVRPHPGPLPQEREFPRTPPDRAEVAGGGKHFDARCEVIHEPRSANEMSKSARSVSLSLGERVGVRASVSQTVSHHAGHVTKASDPSQAYGAVIGKAMSSLPEGQGLVLVLVSLQ
jgi:hypothetical protein